MKPSERIKEIYHQQNCDDYRHEPNDCNRMVEDYNFIALLTYLDEQAEQECKCNPFTQHKKGDDDEPLI